MKTIAIACAIGGLLGIIAAWQMRRRAATKARLLGKIREAEILDEELEKNRERLESGEEKASEERSMLLHKIADATDDIKELSAQHGATDREISARLKRLGLR